VLYAHPDPAGTRFLLGSDTGGNERVQLFLLDEPGGTPRPLVPDPAVIHIFGAWSPDGTQIAYAANSRDPAFFDIYTLALDDPMATPQRVYQQDGSNTVAAWMPDGQALIVTHTLSPSKQDLYLVPLDGGAPRLLTPYDGNAIHQEVQVTPGGSRLFVISDRGREFAALWQLDLASDEWTALAAPDWDVEKVYLAPDGRHLAYTINADGYAELYIRDLAAGTAIAVSGPPPGVIADTVSSATERAPGGAWSADSRRFAFAAHSPVTPLDVWVWDGDQPDQPAVQWTRSDRAGIPESALGAPELVHYPTFDGRQVPAWLFRPTAKAAPPCVVYVHGGPESQTRPVFNPIIAYLVHRGYAVCAPNVRGSTGYGRIYQHLDDVRLRLDAVADLNAAAAWLATTGWVDPARIAVMGSSYGGYMTLAAITSAPEQWAAAVDIVGIANFVTFLEHTGPWRRPLREVEYGSLAADRDFLREISPIHQVDRIRAPLFVIHGANDSRVPVGEAEQIVAQLEARHHPVRYLCFPDEGHGVAKLANRLVAYPAIADFLDQHLAGG
jgi:dipeptidyl aminopeptidase/acylaminoacyl peptidase